MRIERGAHPRRFIGDHPGGFADDLSIQRLARHMVGQRTEQRRQRLDPPQRNGQSIALSELKRRSRHGAIIYYSGMRSQGFPRISSLACPKIRYAKVSMRTSSKLCANVARVSACR